ETWNCRMVLAHSVTDAAEQIARAEHIDVLVTDLQLPDGDGFALVREFAGKFPSGRTVLASGILDGVDMPADLIELKNRGMLEIMPKPYDPEKDLRTKIDAWFA